MNTNIDLPQELLYKEGNIWINGKNNQLRYNSKDDATSQWLNPLSTYKVGSSTKLKKGQPVAVGYVDQLDESAQGKGDSAVVLADPSKNQFSVGILLEPGLCHDEVHVQSHGQVEYSLSNKDNDNYYLPPYENNKFIWTYNDIGKPVYVSNKNKGELTLDLAEATYDGGTIICVGRIADAPLGTETGIEYQKILLEVQLSGDVRGVVDTTQISVEIDSNQEILSDFNKSDVDKIIPVKIINGKGILILNDEKLKANSSNDITGVFVAKSENGSLSLNKYLGKTLVITRLGLVSGNFGFSTDSFGKTAFIKNGEIDFSSSNDSIEFKVGVGFGTNKFLVDCRYAKSIQSSEMIGTIKPVFGENLTDAGYALIDDTVHSVYNDEIDWVPLIEQCYAKDIFVFSKNKNGPFTRVNEGGWELYGETTNKGILSKSQPTYFKFRDLHYTLDGGKTCAAQIKFSKEGSPESQAYVWPEQCYQLDIPYKEEGTAGGPLNNSTLKIDISNLVKLGAYMDNNGQNIEAYDIIVQEKESKQIISPGFWQNKDGKYVGYEWQIVVDYDKTKLLMITQPDGVSNQNCLGVTWPIGSKIQKELQLFVTVRRRPTQYNSIYLNQFPMSNPWTPLVDSANNLVIQGTRIYFDGKLEGNVSESDDGTSGFTREQTNKYVEFYQADGEGTAGIKYKFEDAQNSKVNKFKQSFIIGDGKTEKEISWTYYLDGENPVAELNAQFAASFTAEDTSSVEGDSRYSKDVLSAFRALYPSVFKTESGEKISIIKSRILDFEKNGFNEKIFDDMPGSFLGNEVDIKESNPDVSQVIKDGFQAKNRIYLQSFLGVISRAIGQTDERILKLERILYGADYVINKYNLSQTFNSNYDLYMDNLGLLRTMKFLSEYLFIDTNNSLSLDLTADGRNDYKSLLLNYIVDNYGDYNVDQNFSSSFEQDLVGKRRISEAYDDFNSIKSKKELLAFLTKSFENKTSAYNMSHIAELWINYKAQSVINTALYNTRYARLSSGIMPHTVKSSSIRMTTADSITLLKFTKGYNTDTEYRYPEDEADYKGAPFVWPIYLDENWSKKTGYTVEENFFGNNIFGISDETGGAYKGEGYTGNADNRFDGLQPSMVNGALTMVEGEPATFSPQSVEGLIYDIIVKLSFIRKQFMYDTKFSPYKTYLSSFTKIKWDNTIIPVFETSNEEIFNDMSSDENVYSAFVFSGDKIVRGYGIENKEVLPDYEYSNFSNFDFEDDNEIKKINDRWNKSRYEIVINSLSFNKANQMYGLYVLFCLGSLEAEIFQYAFDGEEVKNEKTGENEHKDPDVNGMNERITKYNEAVDSLITGDVCAGKYKSYNSNLTKSAFINFSNLKTYTDKIKHSVITVFDNSYFENNKTYICYRTTQIDSKGNEKTVWLPNISENYSLNLGVRDVRTEWGKYFKESFSGDHNSEEFYAFLYALHEYEVSEQFLRNLLPTSLQFENGQRTWVTETSVALTKAQYDSKFPSYAETVKFTNDAINDTYTALNKYKFFFGFLNGITGENSEYERNDPWTQRPIANNHLVWKDNKNEDHSADFNDYIEKISHPIIAYNLFAEDDEIILTIKDAEETDPQVVQDRGWKYVAYKDSDEHNESEIDSIDIVPVALIEDHDEYLNNNYGYNIRNSNSEDNSLYEEILSKEKGTDSSINRESIQIGEILEPKVPGHPLIAFEQSNEYISKDNGVNDTKYKVRIPPFTEYDGDFEYQDTDENGNALYYDMDTFEVTTTSENELLGENNIIKYAPKKNSKGQILYLTADGKETIYEDRATYFDWSGNKVHKYAYATKPHYKDVYNYKDYTDSSQGGFKEGHFIEKEYFSDGIKGSYEESIPTDVRHDVLIKDNTIETTQGGDKSQRVEKNINKDSILMSSRENENILIDTASCEENNRNKPRTFVQDIDAKTELNDNKDDSIKVYSNIENHAVKEYELSFANKNALVDVSLTVDNKSDKNFNNITKVSSSTQFVKAGLGLQSQEYVRSDLEILTTEKEGGYIDGFELDAQDAIAADGFEFKPAQKETTSSYLTSVEIDENDASKVVINEDCQDTVVESVDVESASVDVSTIKDAVNSVASKTNDVIDNVNTTKGVLKNIIAKVNEIVSKLEGVEEIADSVSENISQIDEISLDNNLDVNVTLSPTQLKVSSLLNNGLSINDANITLKSDDDIPSLTHGTTKPSIVDVTRHRPELKFSKHTPVFENYAEGNAKIDVETQKIGLTTKANKFYFDHSFISSERVLEHKSVISSLSDKLKLVPDDSINSATVVVRYKKIDSGIIVYKTNFDGTVYEETMKNSEFSNAQTVDGWTPVIDRVESLGTNVKQITFNPLEHKHEITRNNEVVHTQGNFDHAYKEYYVKPLHRNLISLEDSFYRAPVIKMTVEKSIGRYDYHQSKYIFNTRTNMPSIKEGNTFVHEFKFKDNSYIHGRMLPVPDIKTRLKTKDLLSLFKIAHTNNPNKLETAEFIENARLNGSYVNYEVHDSYGRKLQLTYNGYTTQVVSLTLAAFNIDRKKNSNGQYDPINIPISVFMDLESFDGKSKYEIPMYRTMKNFILIPKFSNRWRVIDEKASTPEHPVEKEEVRDSYLGSYKDMLTIRMAQRNYNEKSCKYEYTNQETVEWKVEGQPINKYIDFESMMDFIKDNIVFIASTSSSLKAIDSGVIMYDSEPGSFLESNLLPSQIVVGKDLVEFKLV